MAQAVEAPSAMDGSAVGRRARELFLFLFVFVGTGVFGAAAVVAIDPLLTREIRENGLFLEFSQTKHGQQPGPQCVRPRRIVDLPAAAFVRPRTADPTMR